MNALSIPGKKSFLIGWAIVGLGAVLLLTRPVQGQVRPGKRGVALFIHGEGATSLIGDPSSGFRKSVQEALKDHTAQFWLRGTPHDKDQVLSGAQKADIFYFSGHGGAYDNMHILRVSPSPGNRNFASHKLNPFKEDMYYVTAPEFQRLGPTPTLVILNCCELGNSRDGVPEKNRIEFAFGITNDTKGRALLCWPTKVVGEKGDEGFRRLLVNWTRRVEVKDRGGKSSHYEYRSLKEVIDGTEWPLGLKPTLIGDPNLTYGGLFGIELPFAR